MANIKVSEMTEATSFDDGDYTMIVQANQNKKITRENILGDIEGDISTNATNISTINTNIGDLTNLQTPSTENLVNAINSNLPVILYDNTDGSNATITLLDSVENYSYIEIYYTDNQKMYYEGKKFTDINNKNITISVMATGGSHGFFHRICNYSVVDNTISPTYYAYYALANNKTISDFNYNTNYVYITKVIGYK